MTLTGTGVTSGTTIIGYIGGTGGTGATASVAATAGTNGGGSGGGFPTTYASPTRGSILSFENGLYYITGGTGGKGGPSGNYNAGGNGGAGVYSDTGTLTYGDGLVVFTYTTSTNVAPSGGFATALAGTLSPSQTLTQALSSGSAGALAGTLSPSQTLTQALSSASALALAGIINTSNNQEVNLSSVFALASGGTLTNSQLITQALTGVSVNGQTSSFPVFLELVGASAAGTTGLFGYVNTGWQPINTAGGSTSWIDVDTQQT
jgi:hypothetical protein